MVNINKLNGGNITITTGGNVLDATKTRVKYTAASGLSDWSEEIQGVISGAMLNPQLFMPTSQIPNVKSAQEIDFGNKVTGIGNYAFYQCSSLTRIEIPGSVTGIGRIAFDSCISLTGVTIPDSVTSIGDYTFRNCTNLTNVTIGSGITNIGGNAFKDCTSLTSVVFKGKTIEQVQNIEDDNGNKYYPWGISDTSIITVA